MTTDVQEMKKGNFIVKVNESKTDVVHYFGVMFIKDTTKSYKCTCVGCYDTCKYGSAEEAKLRAIEKAKDIFSVL